jgi:hypothetical protein
MFYDRTADFEITIFQNFGSKYRYPEFNNIWNVILMNKTQHKSETHLHCQNCEFGEKFFFLAKKLFGAIKADFYIWYCTGNMLKIVCGKFGFLSNNCSAKKLYFIMLLYTVQAIRSQFSKKL